MLNLKNLGIRIATGIVFIAVLMAGILFNQYAFLLVFSLITAWASYEFYTLVVNKTKHIQPNKILNTIGSLCLFVGTHCYLTSSEKSFIYFVPYIIYFLILFTSELYLKKTDPLKSLAFAALGQMYVAIPLSLLNYLAFSYDLSGKSYHFAYLLALFVFIWVNDSFAYLTGSLFGKNKMFERISPKKSWEGFIGGAVFSIGTACIFSNYFTELPIWGWIGFAIVTIVFGTWGDLIESLFKRTLDVKDSGNSLPGHGGILDRIDSVIFAIPALFVYIEIISQL